MVVQVLLSTRAILPTYYQITSINIRLLKKKTRLCRNVSKLWSTHVLRVNATMCCECCVCCVCCMCSPKLVVNKSWLCGAGQMLTSVVRTRPRSVCTCSNDSVDWAASANINSCKLTRFYFSLFVILQTMVQVRHMGKLPVITWWGALLCVSHFLLQQRILYHLRCCLKILAPDSISRHLSQFRLFLQCST